MKIIKSQDGSFTPEGGKQLMEAFLKAEGKNITAVYAHNDGMALGAIQAIEEARPEARQGHHHHLHRRHPRGLPGHGRGQAQRHRRVHTAPRRADVQGHPEAPGRRESCPSGSSLRTRRSRPRTPRTSSAAASTSHHRRTLWSRRGRPARAGAGARMPEGPILQIKQLSKQFPGVKALVNVDFALRKGEIHALMGENGAGKSTLIKVLTGVYPRDGGEILFEGRPFSAGSPHQAQAQGISTVYQEINLVQNLSVGREPAAGAPAAPRRPDRRPGDEAPGRGDPGPAQPAPGRQPAAGRLLHRRPADGGHRPRAGVRLQDPDPRRADLQPRRRRGGAALPRDAQAQGGGGTGSSSSPTSSTRSTPSPTGSPCCGTASWWASTRRPGCPRWSWSPSCSGRPSTTWRPSAPSRTRRPIGTPGSRCCAPRGSARPACSRSSTW